VREITENITGCLVSANISFYDKPARGGRYPINYTSSAMMAL
jgi:hypothetical protein